ncbi:PadR family transcriptional regulator [bacterium]|nr:PadR family transcriptional regulator [bacterium]
MTDSKAELLQGTLDMLILKTLAMEPMHGYGIAVRIQQISKDVLRVNQGSLYPALRRLERRGWIEAEWGESENNRRARFYHLTKAGRKQLKEETMEWERLAQAVARILEST